MKLRSNTEPEELQELTDHGGSRKRWASTQDVAPDLATPTTEKQKQSQMSNSKEDKSVRNNFHNAMAFADGTRREDVLNAEQTAQSGRKGKGRAVRFKNEELTAKELLEEETERRLSELDGDFLRRLSDEVDRELADFSDDDQEEEQDELSARGCDHGSDFGRHEEQRESSLHVARTSNGTIVRQVDVVETTTKAAKTKPKSDPTLSLSDTEIKTHYLALKASAWKWATTHFSSVPTSAKLSPTLNLLHLAETSPELMEYIDYISAGGDSSWEDVFHEQRVPLVFGVLGKILEVHVFGCEMFGAAEEELGILRERDTDMPDADGAFSLHPFSTSYE